MAALALLPTDNRVRLFFRLHVDLAICSRHVIDFLRSLECLKAPILLVWDRSSVHKAGRTRSFLAAQRHLQVFWFPAYAPELNPMEYGWSHLKMNSLANLACREVIHLARATRRAAKLLQYRPDLLRSFIHHSPLFFDRP